MNGSRLREARKAANLSQAELAEQAQVSQPLVSALEHNGASSRPPWPDGVRRIAAALGVDPDELFGAVDPWSRAQRMREADRATEATA
jgi:transcriptional regulator with XRE-family HTH domain